MNPVVRLRRAAVWVSVVIALGTTGYVVIERSSWFDAFYMTIVTVSTVGYEEVFPLSEVGRAFTAGLIIVGVSTALYTAGAALEVFVEQVSDRGRKALMQREIDRMEQHHIVCGYGRVGSATWRDMASHGARVVIVEADPDKAARARAAGAMVVEGDATRNEVLIEAGIHRAKAIVASVESDSDNLVIVLSARSLEPGLRIVSRAKFLESETKLLLAGADKVVAPQQVGARRLAAMALQPDLADFVDLVIHGHHVEFRVARIEVQSGSGLEGLSLRDADIREVTGAQVLAIERANGEVMLNPDPGAGMEAGDVLVTMGRKPQLGKVTGLATRVGPQNVDTASASG